MDQDQQVETESSGQDSPYPSCSQSQPYMSHVNTNQGISPLSAFVKAFFSVILVS